MELEAEIIEMESFFEEGKRNFEQNRDEIKILEKLLKECYELAEPTRLKHKEPNPSFKETPCWRKVSEIEGFSF